MTRNQLIEENLPLVYKIAHQYKGLEYDDLVQEGSIGLIKAADSYDPSKGCSFGTYAATNIHHFILDAIYNQSDTIRIPKHTKEQLNTINKFQSEYYLINGREPSIKEISRQLHIPEDKILFLLSVKQPISLNTPLTDEEELTVGDTIKDDSNEIENSETRLALQQMLKNLLPEEQLILEERYTKETSYQQIARKMRISIEKVKKIEKTALKKLKNDIF